MFYPGLLDFYCPVSDDLLELAHATNKPSDIVGHNSPEGERSGNFVSPELFDDPEAAVATSGEAEGKLKGECKPPFKETITKLLTEGRLSHQQVCALVVSLILRGKGRAHMKARGY